jgi:hypothetical protein
MRSRITPAAPSAWVSQTDVSMREMAAPDVRDLHRWAIFQESERVVISQNESHREPSPLTVLKDVSIEIIEMVRRISHREGDVLQKESLVQALDEEPVERGLCQQKAIFVLGFEFGGGEK